MHVEPSTKNRKDKTRTTKPKAFHRIVGQVMKESGGTADPQVVRELVAKEITDRFLKLAE